MRTFACISRFLRPCCVYDPHSRITYPNSSGLTPMFPILHLDTQQLTYVEKISILFSSKRVRRAVCFGNVNAPRQTFLVSGTRLRNMGSQYSDGLRSGHPGFDFWQGQEIFLFCTASRPALGPRSLLFNVYLRLLPRG